MSLDGVQTLQDVFNAITAAAARAAVSVGLNAAGDAITLTDSGSCGGNLTVAGPEQLDRRGRPGDPRHGPGSTLAGWPISDGAGDLRITLTNGTKVDVDLSDVTTLQDVFDAIHAASPNLSASLDPTATAIRSGHIDRVGPAPGPGLYGGLAAEDLGIAGTAPAGCLNGALYRARPIAISTVTLTGGAGNDTLDRGPGNDTLTGGGGNNVISGGGGTATLVESGDYDFTLTDTLD